MPLLSVHQTQLGPLKQLSSNSFSRVSLNHLFTRCDLISIQSALDHLSVSFALYIFSAIRCVDEQISIQLQHLTDQFGMLFLCSTPAVRFLVV